MKSTKLIICAMVAGAVAFAASNASAFPLKLTSVSGKLTVTTNYSALSTSGAKFTTGTVNLKKIMLVISNQVVLNTTTNHPPADAYLAINLYPPVFGGTFDIYLTNSAGYYYSISLNETYDFGDFNINDIATSYHGSGNGGSESDSWDGELDLWGTGPDDNFYETEIIGTGTIKYSVSGNGAAKMTVTGMGGGYGELADSEDGTTSSGKFTFTGSGTPEWGGPYAVAWWFY